MADPVSRTGLTYASKDILDFVNRVHAPHDAALAAAFEAPTRHGMPAIQVGPSEGRTLEILLLMIGARRVVEVGTLAGYSAIRMARSLPPDGHLFSIEYDPRHAEVARQAIEEAGLSSRVSVHVGKGLELLPTLEGEGPFDAVFIDADKASYDQYGRWAARNLRPGGLLLADNVYLFGKLLDDSPEAMAMRRFHEEAREPFHSVCVPTPDGLLVGLRK